VRQIVGRNPWPGVSDLYLDMAFLSHMLGRLEARTQDDPAGWANRLKGIHTQIEENLLQLFRVTHDRWQPFG